MRKKITERLIEISLNLEVILSIFIIICVVIGFIDIARYFKIIFETPPVESFSIMQTFLGHSLTLVIALELVDMLVRHTPSSVIEVLLYAIARKIIIESTRMLDVVLGIIAIIGVFTINRVFISGKFFKQGEDEKN